MAQRSKNRFKTTAFAKRIASKGNVPEATAYAGMPTTRYQGSKRKILPWLDETFQRLEFETVLDVFGGTGSVSYLLKSMGKRVTYNDYLLWNHAIGTALIENDGIKLDEREIQYLIQPVHPDTQGFVTQHFKNIYFTHRENQWIDTITTRIETLFPDPKKDRYKRALARYCLYQTCLVKRPFNLFHRANLSLRQADVERSFGNKTTWDTSFAKHYVNFAEEINESIIKGKHPCKAIHHEATAIPARKYDLIYLDPPYLRTGKALETADYHRCYHFLEGLAQYANWDKMIDRASSLKLIQPKSQNPWISTEASTEALETLLDKFQNSTVVISYRKFGCPSIDTLRRILQRRGKKVTVQSKHYKYALNQQNGSAAQNRECLVIGR
ncbi:MAG TPA: DNA adenine methylase [Verrucomicrobiae bacterium]